MIPTYLMGDVLCFDTETAVLGDKICEMGFTLFRGGEPISSWNSFVNPQIPIDPEAAAVHKIYDSDVENAPTFKDIGWYIYNAFNSADVYVAYNYEYDRKVIGLEFDRIGLKWPIKPVLDPFIFFKQWHKYNKGKKLVNAAEKYGIPYVGAHRANNDAVVTGRLLFKMAATKTGLPKTLKDLMKKQRQWVEDQYLDFAKYRESKGLGPIDKPNLDYFEEPLR